MSRFSRTEIESLIAKAKDLRLSRLRVADGESEISIDLPRSARISAVAELPVAPAPTDRDVASQFVGYFRPSVDTGITVSKNMVVGVVESLGLPNDVVAPTAGRLAAFLVEDGAAVEYGTVVARIET